MHATSCVREKNDGMTPNNKAAGGVHRHQADSPERKVSVNATNELWVRRDGETPEGRRLGK